MTTKTIFKLYDKDYCCAFCSHGETAEITETCSDSLNASKQSRLRYAVTCVFCRAEYPLYDKTDSYHDINTTMVIDLAMDFFIRYIEYIRGEEDYISAR